MRCKVEARDNRDVQPERRGQRIVRVGAYDPASGRAAPKWWPSKSGLLYVTNVDEEISLKIYEGLFGDPSVLAAGYPINETPWIASGLNYAKMMAATSQAHMHIVWLQQQIEALMGDAEGLILATTALPPPTVGPANLIQSPS